MKSRQFTSMKATTTAPQQTVLLRTIVDALLDSLTIEQQAKMASYLMRIEKERLHAVRVRSIFSEVYGQA